MKRIVTIICVFLCLCISVFARNLDKMNETERREALLHIATEWILEFAPDFYRDYGEPEILHGYVNRDLLRREVFGPDLFGRSYTIEGAPQSFTEPEFVKYRGRSFYSVTFFFDKTVEAFRENFSSRVMIWGDTGKVFQVRFGAGGTFSGGLDDPEVIENRRREGRLVEWQMRPPGYFDPPRRVFVGETPPLSDGSMRSAALRGLLLEDELQEAIKRNLLTESEIKEIKRR